VNRKWYRTIVTSFKREEFLEWKKGCQCEEKRKRTPGEVNA